MSIERRTRSPSHSGISKLGTEFPLLSMVIGISLSVAGLMDRNPYIPFTVIYVTCF